MLFQRDVSKHVSNCLLPWVGCEIRNVIIAALFSAPVSGLRSAFRLFQDSRMIRHNILTYAATHNISYDILECLRMSYLELKYVWLRRAALEGRLQWVIEDFMSRCAVAWPEQTTREHGNSKSQKHLLYFIKITKPSSTVSQDKSEKESIRIAWTSKNVLNNFGFVDVLDLWNSLKKWTLSASVSNGLGL